MAKHTGIRKLANGRFRARYFAGYDKNGKRQYPAKTFDTERAAREWRAGELSARAPGRIYEGRALTVDAYLDSWLAIKKQSLRGLSHVTYTRTLKSYVRPFIGKIKLTRLTPNAIEAMQAQLLAADRKPKRLSKTTVTFARSILHDALEKAVRQGLIRSNPIKATDSPGYAKPQRYPLTVEDALRFLNVCEHSQEGLLFTLSLNTGLRPEEVIAVRWSDLEIAGRGVLRVSKVIHVVPGGGWQWQEPKTVNSERAIVFPAPLAARLAEHRRAQLEQKLKMGSAWQDNDLVFCSPIGRPFTQWRMRARFKKLMAEAGLPAYHRWYDLRHAFVSFSLVAGVDAKTVSREAGHHKVAFTLDRYGHVLDEMHEAASDKRENLLRSRSSKSSGK